MIDREGQMVAPIRFTVALAACAAILGLSACESPGATVSVLQSDTRAVPAGAAYAWKPAVAPDPSADPRINNDIIQERLHRAVDTALAAKGFRLVDDPGQAQLLVSYHVSLQEKRETQVQSFGSAGPVYCGMQGCIGGWGGYGPPTTDVRTIDYVQGTLLLDLVDRATGKLVWRGTSQKRLDDSPADQRELNALLADLTKGLPG